MNMLGQDKAAGLSASLSSCRVFGEGRKGELASGLFGLPCFGERLLLAAGGLAGGACLPGTADAAWCPAGRRAAGALAA